MDESAWESASDCSAIGRAEALIIQITKRAYDNIHTYSVPPDTTAYGIVIDVATVIMVFYFYFGI